MKLRKLGEKKIWWRDMDRNHGATPSGLVMYAVKPASMFFGFDSNQESGRNWRRERKRFWWRNSAIAVLNSVTIAPITSTIRNIPTEVILTRDDGLPNTCAANFDNIQTVPRSHVGDRIARLTARRMTEAAAAVSFALGFDDE